MNSTKSIKLLVLFVLIIGIKNSALCQLPSDKVVIINQFKVPEQAKEEFKAKLSAHLAEIKEQPGLIFQNVYENEDETGNLMCVTIVEWENETAYVQAFESIRQKIQKTGFDYESFNKRLGITFEQNIFREMFE